MAVSVVDSACEEIGNTACKIVVEGGSVEEVLGTNAKQAALAGGRHRGMFRPGISNQSGPYPVDADGNDCTLQTQPGMRYRNDFTLSGGIGQ